MSRRRERNEENMFALLLDLTDMYWPFGAASSTLFMVLGLITLSWVLGIKAEAETSPFLAPLANSLGAFLFVLPSLFFLMTAISGAKALKAFSRDHH